MARGDTDEDRRVVAWRLHVLLEAGYPLAVADMLAEGEQDVHELVKLKQGPLAACPDDLLAGILL